MNLNPEQAHAKAQSYCAYQERCQQEVRYKLYQWGLAPEAAEELISRLVTENFLNEERFAIAFAGGKFRIKKWGPVKIRLELKKRKISDYCIKQGMKEIPYTDCIKTLKKLLKEHGPKYAISRGFETEMVWELLRK